jgi:predicted DNA-binding transcriptional regulator AlpA
MSRLTREDYAEMRRCNERPGASLAAKALEQMVLDRQKEEYFAKGGRICGVPVGTSAFVFSKPLRISIAEPVPKDTMGIKEAAKYCGVSRRCIGNHIVRGSGPVFIMANKARRFTKADLDAWMTLRKATA